MTPDPREDFLAGLRGVGRVDSKGFFSLDPRKAREKMRQFQLVDPHQYVLEWIQAAVAGGATSLVVRADVQDVTLVATGWTLDPEFLREPLAGLFISQEKSELESYRHLSIGLNAALALSPRALEIASGGFLLRMAGAEQVEVVRLDEAGEEGTTRVRCVQRWSWKLAQRACLLLGRGVPEEELLRDRAVYCPIPLRLGERVVSAGEWRDMHHPLAAAQRPALSHAYEGRLLRGVLDLPGELLEKSRLHVVKHGITTATREVRMRHAEALVLVHADRLLTTASNSDLVEEDRWKSVLWELDKAGAELVLAACRRYESEPAARGPLESHLLAALSRCVRGSASSPEARQLEQALVGLPLFRTSTREGCSFSRLREAGRGKSGRVYYHVGAPSLPLPEDELVVIVDTEQWEVLRDLLGEKVLVPITSQARLLRRAANQARWRRAAERAEGRLPLPHPLEVLCEMCLEQEPFRCTIALQPYVPEQATGLRKWPRNASVAFYLGGKLLCRREMPSEGRYFQASIVGSTFRPDYTYDGIEEDEHYEEARRFLLAAGAALLHQWLARAAESCDHLDATQMRLHLLDHLHAVSREGTPVQELPPEVLGHPLFATVSGRLASLADLLRDVEEFGAVHWVQGDLGGPQSDHRQLVQADRDLDRAFGERNPLALLKRLFAGRVVDFTARLLAERKLQERRGQPREEGTLAGRALLPVEVRGERLRGMVGLALPSAVASAQGVAVAPLPAAAEQSRGRGGRKRGGRASQPAPREGRGTSFLCVRLLKDGRPVETRRVPFPWGPLEAVVDGEDFEVDADWERVLPCPALTATWAAIEEAGHALAVLVAREAAVFTGWKREVAETFLLGYLSCRREGVPVEVEQVPLFPCVEEWRRLTLADVRREIAAHGSLRCVTRRSARPGSPADGRPFLLLGGESGRVLRELVGDAALVDASKELEEEIARQGFLLRPLQELALSDAEAPWLVEMPVEGRCRGVAGLLPLPDEFDGTVTLRVLFEQRELTRLVVLSAVPGEVVLAADGMRPARDFQGLASEEAEEGLREQASQAVARCVEALLAQPVEPHSPEARVLMRLVVARARDPHQVASLAAESLEGRAARVPLVTDSTGEKASLLEVASVAAEEGRLRYVRPGIQGCPAAGRVFVLLTREVTTLSRAFRKALPYEEQLVDEDQAGIRKREAPRVDAAAWPRDESLVWIDLERDGLRGVLAVCPGLPGEVVLASEGREVQRVALFGRLPVVGVLQGTLLRPDRAWGSVEISARVRKRLDEALDALYVQVAAQVAEALPVENHGATAPAAVGSCDAAQGAGAEAARDALLAYFVHRRLFLSLSADSVPPGLCVRLFPAWGGEPRSLADVVRQVASHGFLSVSWRSPGAAVLESGGLVMSAESWSVQFYREFFGVAVVREMDSVLRDIACTLSVVTAPLLGGMRAMVEGATRSLGVAREKLEGVASQAGNRRARQEAVDRVRRREEERRSAQEARRRRLEAQRVRALEAGRVHAARQEADARAQARKELLVGVQVCLEQVSGWRRTRLHDELIRHLGWARGTTDRHLVRVEQRKVWINPDHPLVERAVALRTRRPAVAMLASAVVTAINQQLLEVTDEDELRFLRGLADWIG